MPPGPAYNWLCVLHTAADIAHHAASIRASQLAPTAAMASALKRAPTHSVSAAELREFETAEFSSQHVDAATTLNPAAKEQPAARPFIVPPGPRVKTVMRLKPTPAPCAPPPNVPDAPPPVKAPPVELRPAPPTTPAPTPEPLPIVAADVVPQHTTDMSAVDAALESGPANPPPAEVRQLVQPAAPRQPNISIGLSRRPLPSPS
jgi:aarF domain-containing kinase